METFDMGRVLQTAEAIKGMRDQSVTERLRQQYMGAQIQNTQQAGQIAQSQEQRAQRQFSAEQQFTNTRSLNMAAKAVATDPSSIGMWLPVLRDSGVLSPDFDPSGMEPQQLQQVAQSLATQTDAVLGAYMKANPAMAEIDARHQASLAEIAARVSGESTLASQNNQFTREQIMLRGAQDRATERAKAPGRDMRTAQTLRKEFEGLDSVKNYRAVVPMIQSAERAPDTGYGDLDLIYAVGKILDPASVVREGELKLVLDAGSPLQKVLGTTRFNFEKGGRITPKQREQLLGMLKGRVGALKEGYEREAARFGQYASESGLEPSQVIGQQSADPAPRGRVRVDASGNVIQ